MRSRVEHGASDAAAMARAADLLVKAASADAGDCGLAGAVEGHQQPLVQLTAPLQQRVGNAITTEVEAGASHSASPSAGPWRGEGPSVQPGVPQNQRAH